MTLEVEAISKPIIHLRRVLKKGLVPGTLDGIWTFHGRGLKKRPLKRI
jgi:hypothetical protein